jgi:hypothetical protein
MIAENFKLLIEKLKLKTIKREACWTKTSRDEEYKLHLGKKNTNKRRTIPKSLK